MKILFFIDNLSPGGKERRLVELMKGLRLRPDMHFELVLLNEKVHFKEVFQMGIKIHYLIRKIKKDPSIFLKVYKICKQYNPDLVHCWDDMSAVYLIPTVKLLKIKFVNGMVVSAPEKQSLLNKGWWRAKFTFPFSNIIIGNSQAGLAAYNVPENKSICIHNGFDFKRTETLIPGEIIKEKFGITTTSVVGMVATFSKNKDYRTYFSAAQMVLEHRNDVIFLAVGEGTDCTEAKDLIEKKYSEYFRLIGRSSEVESLINIMDVCVLATFTEGISNSILEYMALGKPVIATSGGGTNEIIIDKATGFLVKAKTPEAIAEKITLLLNDKNLRAKIGEEGNKRVHENFSINKMVNAFIETYQRVVAQ